MISSFVEILIFFANFDNVNKNQLRHGAISCLDHYISPGLFHLENNEIQMKNLVEKCQYALSISCLRKV